MKIPHPRFTLTSALKKLGNGALTPSDLLEDCLIRIEQFDPAIQAWVKVDAEGARKLAAKQTLGYERDTPLGPLAGVPIGVKDIFDIAGWSTQAGSPLRKNHIAEADAPVVAALRKAGAILLGKTVTTQFACFDPAPTRNPHQLEYSPGGSSSGSAAAVASGMCLAALGSQTGGSITRPASYCGVAGLKPTFGALSLEGVVPVSPRLDHPGVIARTAADLEAIWQVIGAPRESEIPRPPHPKPVSGKKLDPAMEPFRHVWFMAPFLTHEQPLPSRNYSKPWRLYFVAKSLVPDTADLIVRGVERLSNDLKRAGADTFFGDIWEESRAFLPINWATWQYHRKIMAYDARAYHLKAYEENPEGFAPGLAKLFAEGAEVTQDEYEYSLYYRDSLRSDIDRTLHFVDAIVTPATTSLAPPLSANSTGDPRWNSPFSLTGHPTVSIPIDFSESRLPWGIQIVGPYHSETRLFKIAKWIEEYLDEHRALPWYPFQG